VNIRVDPSAVTMAFADLAASNWERTPRWMFWRPAWRRLYWHWNPHEGCGGVDELRWEYARPTDFLLM
jgi:hypothetical protein